MVEARPPNSRASPFLTVSADPNAPLLKDGVLVVRATGATTHSASVLVQVDTPPTVSINSPDEGTTVSGSTLVEVSATPGENTSIASIAIAIDGNSPLSSTTGEQHAVGHANRVQW